MRCIRSRVRGYPVRKVSRRVGVSTDTLYNWLMQFGEQVSKPGLDHGAENRRLKRERARVTEDTTFHEPGPGRRPTVHSISNGVRIPQV